MNHKILFGQYGVRFVERRAAEDAAKRLVPIFEQWTERNRIYNIADRMNWIDFLEDRKMNEVSNIIIDSEQDTIQEFLEKGKVLEKNCFRFDEFVSSFVDSDDDICMRKNIFEGVKKIFPYPDDYDVTMKPSGDKEGFLCDSDEYEESCSEFDSATEVCRGMKEKGGYATGSKARRRAYDGDLPVCGHGGEFDVGGFDPDYVGSCENNLRFKRGNSVELKQNEASLKGRLASAATAAALAFGGCGYGEDCSDAGLERDDVAGVIAEDVDDISDTELGKIDVRDDEFKKKPTVSQKSFAKESLYDVVDVRGRIKTRVTLNALKNGLRLGREQIEELKEDPESEFAEHLIQKWISRQSAVVIENKNKKRSVIVGEKGDELLKDLDSGVSKPTLRKPKFSASVSFGPDGKTSIMEKGVKARLRSHVVEDFEYDRDTKSWYVTIDNDA